MSGFSIDWLDLREVADNKARDPALLQQTKAWLLKQNTQNNSKIVVDLGSGTGSTLRAFYLLDTNPQPLTWRLIDQDAALLAEAERRHSNTHSLNTIELNLTHLDALPLEGASLVSASALFDLVSANYIDELIKQLLHRCPSAGFYAALNYDGTTTWSPPHPLDQAVLEAFNKDQKRNKGFGPALGPDAAPYMEQAFKEKEFQVAIALSPWQLDGKYHAMVSALIVGIAEAVAASTELDRAGLADWVQFRKANIENGTCTVGHIDLLALPLHPEP